MPEREITADQIELCVLETGLLYRNPKPHTRSIHAYFPWVVSLPNGEMLATLCLGQAFEATDLHTWLARSRDNGVTWELEGRLCADIPDRLMTDASRISIMPDGELVVFLVRHDRSDHPDEGFTNTENLGFVPTELFLMRSNDGGHTWTEPEPLEPPLVGPSFELCSPITPLRDGRWLLPTATWRGWDGFCPNGMRTVAFVSHDRGRTWPEYMDLYGGASGSLIHFESKVVELADGRLLSAAWRHEEATAKDFPNQYVVSRDGGRTWTPPASTGLHGQTGTPLVLPDDRILYVYRRIDRPGLWAALVRLEENQWITESQTPLWGTSEAGLTAHSDNMAQNFQVLRFGAPCLNYAPDGAIFVAFWCVEDCVSNIRWFRLCVE
jgi:sialidase-1